LFEDKTIAFIGPGAMAEAMISGLIRNHLAAPEALVAAGPRLERLESLKSSYGIHIQSENSQAASRTWWCSRSSRSG